METASITFSRAAPDEAWDANQTKEAPQTVCLACPPHNKHTAHTCGTRGRLNPLPRGPKKGRKKGPEPLAELCGACMGKGGVHTCGNFDDNAAPAPVAPAPPPLEEEDDSSDADSAAFGITSFENEEELRKACPPPPPKPSRSPSPSPPRMPSPPRRARQKGGQKCGPWFQYWLENDAAASEEFWQALGDADKRPIRVLWTRKYEESLRATGQSMWLQSPPPLPLPLAAQQRYRSHGRSPSPSRTKGAGIRPSPPGWRAGDSLETFESDRPAPVRAPGAVPKRYNNDKAWQVKPKRPRIKDARPEVPRGTRVRLADPRFRGKLGTVVDHKHAWYRVQLDTGGVQSVRVMFLQREDGSPMHPEFARRMAELSSDESD